MKLERIFEFFFLINVVRSEEITTSQSTATSTLFTTTQRIFSSCSYCKNMMCRCLSSNTPVLNCSSYLLNLTLAQDCVDDIIWNTVDFSFRNLDSIDVTKLLSLKMNRLVLKSNSIMTIPDGTFDDIADFLLELDLQMNQLSTVSSKWLNSKLVALKKLNFAMNQIETLIGLEHVLLPSLEEFNVSWNQIEIFPNEINQWKSLKILDLSFNKLSSIEKIAFENLPDLEWLSLASNRDLACVAHESFNHLKSLKYLDVSSSNLINVDSCLLTSLSSLRIFKIERVPINCSSCWIVTAKANSIQLFGQCMNNITVQSLDSLKDQGDLQEKCSSQTSACVSNSCEFHTNKLEKFSSIDQLAKNTESSNEQRNQTISVILTVIFSIITLLIIVILVIFIVRWKQGKNLPFCHFIGPFNNTRRDRHKREINENTAGIESIVTHRTDMNNSSHAYQNHYVPSDGSRSSNERKLYNPMFSESPKLEMRPFQQQRLVSNGSMSSRQ